MSLLSSRTIEAVGLLQFSYAVIFGGDVKGTQEPPEKGFWRRFGEAYSQQGATQSAWENSPEGKAHRERMNQFKQLERKQKDTQNMIYYGLQPSQY